ncbi:transcriptional regulator [Streptomyces sp. NBC_01005]|uniref:transcriptional regulator n=1 Tax=unclassified Streptomyces TaxID=2593676 RepID=UPI0038674FC5|nr:transcriptional regulator [Streptomyces sp. NBC_01005]WTC92621.1 transcriptional regulator [Streptomyces sp. NBC_01650]
MSNAALARAVTKRARAQGHRGISPDESSVRQWRAGETPRHPVPQLIAETISERASTTLSPADLGFPDLLPTAQATGLPWLPGTCVQALLHLTRSEVMRTHTRNSTSASRVQKGSALLAPLQQWATTEPSSLTVPAGRTGGQVGAAEVEGIRAVTAMYRDVDNRHGGALSRKAVVAQLNEAASLLYTCTYTERTGRDLLAAVADLGSVAGWMSFDAGHHTSAQKLFITSLHAAAEAGDKALGAHILQCMARQMSHLERYEDALALVDLAQYGARRRLSPATFSMLASLKARFQAILGNLTDSETAAGRAEDAFTGIVPGNEPAHMMFFDTAELSATGPVTRNQESASSSRPSIPARHTGYGAKPSIISHWPGHTWQPANPKAPARKRSTPWTCSAPSAHTESATDSPNCTTRHSPTPTAHRPSTSANASRTPSDNRSPSLQGHGEGRGRGEGRAVVMGGYPSQMMSST